MSVKHYEFCFWVYRRLNESDFKDEPMHDETCRYANGNYLSYSGPAVAVSHDQRHEVVVSIATGHGTRCGIFHRVEGGLPEMQLPFLLTDALGTVFNGFYELEFLPHDPEVEWAGCYEASEGGGPIVYPVASESFFGRIHFTGKTSAYVMAFGTSGSQIPKSGESFWFADRPEQHFGKIQSSRLMPGRWPSLVFARS